MENCIVCDKAVIKKGCNIKSCFIGFSVTVPEEVEKEKFSFTNSSAFLEI